MSALFPYPPEDVDVSLPFCSEADAELVGMRSHVWRAVEAFEKGESDKNNELTQSLIKQIAAFAPDSNLIEGATEEEDDGGNYDPGITAAYMANFDFMAPPSTIAMREHERHEASQRGQLLYQLVQDFVLPELHSLPLLRGRKLWSMLDSVYQGILCPINFSLLGHKLPQDVHDHIWQAAGDWPFSEKLVSWDAFNDRYVRQSHCVFMTDMVWHAIEAAPRAKAAALPRMQVIMDAGKIPIEPRTYALLAGLCDNEDPVVAERAASLIEPLERAKEEDLKKAAEHYRRRLIAWHQTPPATPTRS